MLCKNYYNSLKVLGVLLPNGLISRQINKPHTVENVDELNRIRSEHPSTEHNTLLKSNF